MKGKKLLAGVLSTAMVLGTMAFPVFADDATMTYGDFLTAVADSDYNYDGQGVTVTLKTNIGCGDTRHTESCPKGYAPATAETPNRIDPGQLRAQYKPFENYDGKITIKNVKFVADISQGAGCCRNSGYDGKFDAGTKFYPEFQIENKGSLTVEECSFDGICLAPYHQGATKSSEYTDTITGCEFKNVFRTYGIASLNGGKVIAANNTFDNCAGGIYVMGGGANGVTISGNKFTNMGENAPEEKKHTSGLIQLAAGMPADAEVTIAENTSDGSTPVLRQLSAVDEVFTCNNDFGGSDELTLTGNSTTGAAAPAQKAAVAKNGNTYYKTLADAVASAAFGDTVQLLCDTTGTGIRVDSGKNITIDFGGYKYIMNNPLVGSSKDYETNGFQLLQNSIIIMKNGTLYSDVANILIQNYANLTLEDMNLSLNRVHENPKQPLYTLSNNNGHIVLTGNTNISALDRNFAFDVCRFADYPGVSVTLDENMTGTINGRIELSGTKKADNDFELIIKNGTVNGPIVNSAPTANIQISGGSFTTDVSAYCADGFAAKKIGDVWVVDESASKVSLGFKATDDARVYDIVVKAEDAEKINRLNTADLTFNLTASDAANSSVVYTILPVDNITVTPDMENVNRYMFNFNGKDGVEDTKEEITIGKVQFDGYTTNGAKITFTADADKSLVTATTKSNNLVTYFGNGAFANATAADRKIDGVKFAVPTKKLTVNIAMNNKVADQVKAYQDMKVEIKGANVSKTIDLGSDGTAQTANGGYTVTEELEQNIPYTVTVSGAGYRTARYTVNLNADKTLNFWNNVMDEAKVVEVNNEAYKKNVTFLAGDIVKDNKINIYDLSAVVSYFGTDNLVAEHPEYAKYDLNRDGVIDSKDVAYVLVSWGN